MRVINHSSTRILAHGADGKIYEVGPGDETSSKESISFITACEQSRTIMGAAQWTATSDVHVLSDPSYCGGDLPIRLTGLHLSSAAREDAPRLGAGEPRPSKIRRPAGTAPLVTILGAGITGLTAAHELIERGFRVEVVEKSPGSPLSQRRKADVRVRAQAGLDTPDVGGVARTQWCALPSVPAAEGPTRLTSVSGVDWRNSLPGTWDTGTISPVTFTDARQHDINSADVLRRLKGSPAALQIILVVYREEGPVPAYARLQTFLKSDFFKDDALEYLDFLPVARVEVDERVETKNPYVGLLLRPFDRPGLIAGEHGYRFVPGCYRHLRDTMRRTPIYDQINGRFTTATVHDNLTPLRFQAVNDPTRDTRPAFTRTPPASLAAIVKQYQSLRRDLGYRPADLLRFSLRLLRYMTSSTERRQAYYENISWWDFLTRRHLDRQDETAARVAQRYTRVLQHALETVVALRTTEADARTVGNFSTQLINSNFASDVDSTLRGPSTEVWFRPWREYLERRGVRFSVGEVTSIDTFEGTVDIEFPHAVSPQDFIGDSETKPKEPGAAEETVPPRHFYLCALDAPSVARVTAGKRQVGAAADIQTFVHANVEALHELNPPDPRPIAAARFRTLAGIQLFYRERISPDTSHIYYADSPWSLSAISQVQQWDTYSAIPQTLSTTLSINIGAWPTRTVPDDTKTVEPPVNAKLQAITPANDALSPEAIANFVAAQVAEQRAPKFPTAAYFHIDDYIQFEHTPPVPAWNRAPYLVNVVGDWKLRPRGEPWCPASLQRRPRRLGDAKRTPLGKNQTGKDTELWEHEKGGYVVHPGNIVFAGPHMRTFFRLTSMEAANESARHAVNAILDHLASAADDPDSKHRDPNHHEERTPPHGAYCDIWDPEQNELVEFELARTIDKYLVEAVQELPIEADDLPEGAREAVAPLHLFDLLGVDHLADMIETDASSERVFELLGIALDALERVASKDTSSVLGVIDSFRKQFEAMVRR